MFDLYVFTFHEDGRIYRALSLLSPEEVERHGLPTEAVLGEISALLPTMTPDQFEVNEKFLALLHEIVQKYAPELSTLQGQAKSQGTGYVYIVDQRVKEKENLFPEDIIGQFSVSRGEIKSASYQANERYKVLTDKGPIQLPLLLSEQLLSKISSELAQTA